MKPSLSMRIPCASLNKFSPHDVTNVPSGLSTKNAGPARRRTTICPSGVVETCDAPPHLIPSGSCPHESSTCQFPPPAEADCAQTAVTDAVIMIEAIKSRFISATSLQFGRAKTKMLLALLG